MSRISWLKIDIPFKFWLNVKSVYFLRFDNELKIVFKTSGSNNFHYVKVREGYFYFKVITDVGYEVKKTEEFEVIWRGE